MSQLRASFRVLAFVISILAVSVTPVLGWHGNGDVTAIAVDPLTSGTLYAATSDRGVFKSTDGGAKWSPTGLTNTPVYALVVDPRIPTTLYAVTPLGVVASGNGGDSWSDSMMNCIAGAMECPLINGLPVQNSAATLAISAPTDPSLPVDLYVGVSWYDASFTYYWGEVSSSWGPVTPGGSPWAFPPLRVAPAAIAPAYQNGAAIVYLTVSNEYDVCSVRDAGATVACTLLDQSFAGAAALAVDPRNADVVYAGNTVGVYKSLDGGVTWRRATTGSIGTLLIDPRNPDTVYAGTVDRGVLKSTDSGATWVALGSELITYLNGLALSPNIQALAIDPLVPTTLYAGTPGGIFKSVDGGVAWMPTAFIQHSALISLNVPPRIITGTTATGTVVFNAPAAQGGAVVLLSSSDTQVSVPASVTVPAGATSANFPIATSVWTWSRISATYDDLTKYVDIMVRPTLALWINQPFLIGGNQSTGTVALGLPAPTGGAIVALSSSNPAAASVPASITVPAGAITATFTIATSTVSTNTMATITAAYGGDTPQGSIQLVPSTISALTLNPKTVSAGATSTGTVLLTVPAPAGGAVVTLSSSEPSLGAVPASVALPAGATSATFTVSTSTAMPYGYTYNTKVVGIYGSYNGLVADSLFVTWPPEATISSLTLDSASLTGGITSTGTVSLNIAAPAGGIAVALSSSNPTAAAVPASITVPAGSTSVSFTITTSIVAMSTTVTITAATGAASRNAQLVVTAPPAITLSSLSIVPSSVTAGTPATGTLTLSAAAPAGGVVIALSNSNPAVATAPASATAAPGATSATFTVSTLSCASGSTTVSASYGGATKSAGLAATSTADTVTIQQADYSANKRELTVSARSSNPAAILRAYVSSSGQFIGALRNLGDGRNSGQLSWSVNPQKITISSNACGSVTSVVNSKR